MRYPITLTPEAAGGFSVSFPDIPEAHTQGETREEALDMGLEALIVAFEFYFDGRRPIPKPSRIERGGEFVSLPPSYTARILLLNAMLERQMRPTDLAKQMGVTKQDVNRLLNLKYSPKIDTIALALKALGLGLELRTHPE